jgi:glycerophosphoryl diester phosphodiesterase
MRSMPARLVACVGVAALLAACSDSGQSGSDATGAVTPTTADVASTTSSAPSTDAPTTTVPIPDPITIDRLLALDRPIVLAHTAGEDEFPASTPFAFAESAAANVDMLDMNVLLTADDVLVVQHDDTVDRTTDGTGDVAELTYAEIAALDNAYWFTVDCVCTDQPEAAYLYRGVRTGDRRPPSGYTPDDFVIPRFRDIAERFPSLPLNIEIKGSGEPALRAAQVLADELRALDRLDSVVVTSFDDAVVDAFQALAPEVEVSPGLGATSKWVLERVPLPEGMRILQLPPEYSGLQVITPELVADSAAAGYPIWVWPNDRRLENQAAYLAFLEQGVAGLNINFPAQGVAAVDEFVSST